MPRINTNNHNPPDYKGAGTWFSEGQSSIPGLEGINESIADALSRFLVEFGQYPNFKYTVIEVRCGEPITFVTLYEMENNERS